MKETIFEQVASAASVLKLDLSAEEFALFAEDREFSEAGMEAVQMLLGYLSEKKQQTTIQTLLKMSRLPTKAPKTFENFDFSLLKGKDVERLKVLSSLNAIYSHRNLAFIGPAGTGKTHLAQAFGYACCQHGLKTYFIKASELRDRFTAARRSGNGFVNVYKYIENPQLKILHFSEMTDEWLDFIARCRKGEPHSYDIVEGPMADDTIWDFVNGFMSGKISRSVFWEYAKFKYPTHQISFHTVNALRCLTFERSESIHDGQTKR